MYLFEKKWRKFLSFSLPWYFTTPPFLNRNYIEWNPFSSSKSMFQLLEKFLLLSTEYRATYDITSDPAHGLYLRLHVMGDLSCPLVSAQGILISQRHDPNSHFFGNTIFAPILSIFLSTFRTCISHVWESSDSRMGQFQNNTTPARGLWFVNNTFC